MAQIDVLALSWWLAGGVGSFVLGLAVLVLLALFLAPPEGDEPGEPPAPAPPRPNPHIRGPLQGDER